ncbi:ImmA/IrrE family metallo-endopeptidase [Anaerotruncus massiliensis (ex Liu et al. 2021)]|uniref:ImmA/IrrE family metallo-endopeptidase n=1 Tax=Anaerotruncus massiliensis (ex Liu et al. 2021) TaxID=2321404 RepID=UPI003AB21ED1
MSVSGITKTAWRVLLDTRIERFPVRPTEIARKNDILVFEYSDYMRTTGRSCEEVFTRYGKDGFTQLIGGKYTVFYNHCSSPARCRWTLAHELGHIFLGHITEQCPTLSRGVVKDFLDIQADNFAARLLCPEAIAHFCAVRSEEELRGLFDISKQAAKARWRDLSERRRSAFRLEREEELLLNQFQPFIASYLADRTGPELMPPSCQSLPYRI